MAFDEPNSSFEVFYDKPILLFPYNSLENRRDARKLPTIWNIAITLIAFNIITQHKKYTPVERRNQQFKFLLKYPSGALLM